MVLRDAIRSLRGLNDWRLWAAGAVTACGLAVVESSQAWTVPGGQGRAALALALYWVLWLAWPAALVCLLRLFNHLARGRWRRAALSLLALALCSTLVWARFVEPNQLRVVESSMGTSCGVRVALIADLHAGLFVRRAQLVELVERLNALDVDAVLVAGDWTYLPERDLRATFAPLAGLRHRSYAVLGNHDEQRPGPPLQKALREALGRLGVRVIEGQRVGLGRCELVGLGDRSAGLDERDLAALKMVRSAKAAAQRVVLTHEPNTAHKLGPDIASLVLAGHTHGGQVDLPVLTAAVLARIGRDGFKRGLYTLPDTRVFITSGTGMDHLPLRFRVPPTIDVLAL